MIVTKRTVRIIGWYQVKVISTNPDGTVCLLYWKGKLTETIKLIDLRWYPAHGKDKWYHSTNNLPVILQLQLDFQSQRIC